METPVTRSAWRGRAPLRLSGIIAFCTIVLLAGCARQPTLPAGGAAGVESETLRQQAAAAIAQGDFQAAAMDYLRLSRRQQGAERQRSLLRAAETFLRGNFIEGGRHALSLIDDARLDTTQRLGKRLLEARLALLAQHPDETIRELQSLDVSGLDPAHQGEAHALLAEAYERQGRWIEAARQWSERLDRLEAGADEARRATEDRIWKALLNLTPEELAGPPGPPGDHFAGWRELALIAQGAREHPIDIDERLADWQRRHPAHPAPADIIEALRARARQIQHRPGRVAVLLPQSGPLSTVSEALRNGLLLAYYRSPDYQPDLLFYDTGTDEAALLAAYRQAVDDGAELVLGPLRKTAVEELAGHYERMPVPTLSLNYLPADVTGRPGLVQYGLAPEDEVEQVAERAWLDGHNQALAMIPEGRWGDRLLARFENHWQALGGRLLKSVRYDPRQNDFSHQLRKLLRLDASLARKRRLERLLGARLAYEPRRRQDADFIFLVSTPRAGRLIRPQLNFHFASDLSVYATSHIYSGRPEAGKDRDMDGVVFCDIPWLLSASADYRAERTLVERLWPANSRRYLRFYAMGLDSFDLLGELGILEAYPHEGLRGRTGRLSLLESGRLYRQLVWARFRNGLPRPE